MVAQFTFPFTDYLFNNIFVFGAYKVWVIILGSMVTALNVKSLYSEAKFLKEECSKKYPYMLENLGEVGFLSYFPGFKVKKCKYP